MMAIVERVQALIIKLISVKGVILGLATFFLWADKVTETTWFLAAGAMAGIRAAEKKIAQQQGGGG